MRNSVFLSLVFAFFTISLFGQDAKQSSKSMASNNKDAVTLDIEICDTLTDAYLDTVQIAKSRSINDYSLIGIQYGVGLSQVFWNPSQKQKMVFIPYNFGLTYTKYGKMFGYMPYFGFQTGIFYTQEGYRFKYNKESDYTFTIEGAEGALLNVIEVPVMAHMHIDFWKMKVLVNLGCYAGYRLNIKRIAGVTGNVSPDLEYSFKDTDRRWDYGIKGGIGFGLVFDPVEIHIQGMYKHSLSSLFEPDYANKDYYRYGFPSNIIISVGLHFQITNRTGLTKAQLKKKAYDMVFNSESDK